MLFAALLDSPFFVYSLVEVYLPQPTTHSHPSFPPHPPLHPPPCQRLTHGMLYRKLGKSDLIVSEVALGTMTWGEQVTEEQAHAQLNMAVDEYGVNFIDTAELYPVPADPDTHGLSEKIVGSWLKNRKRSDVIIATKVTGYSDVLTWLRKDDGPVRLTAAQINEAVEGSLKRLGTDYIDLLQLHWPDRYLNLFGVDLYDRSVSIFSYVCVSFWGGRERLGRRGGKSVIESSV